MELKWKSRRTSSINLLHRTQLKYPPYPAQQAFPFSFGAKKDRGTVFSVLTAREMKREPLPYFLFFPRSLTLVPRPLLLNRTETLATQAIFT